MDNKKKSSILKALLFGVIGLIILWLVYRSNNAAYQEECISKNIALADCNLIQKVIEDVKSAKYIWVLLSLFLFMLSNISRAVRWHIMLEPLGYKPSYVNSVSSIMIAYMANLGLPRSGEFVRAGILSKYEGFPPEKVMGTIVIDRIADVFMLIIAIGLTLLLSFDNFYGYLATNLNLSGKVNSAVLWGLLPLIFIGTLLFIFRWKIMASSIGQKVLYVLIGFKEGLLSIMHLKRPIAFIMHSVIIWTCYYLMTYMVFFAFEPTAHLGPVAGLVVFVFGTLGIVFPSPGGMGSYHFLVGEGLALYGIASADAFSFANIIFFSVQLFCNILLGIVALIILPVYNSNRG